MSNLPNDFPGINTGASGSAPSSSSASSGAAARYSSRRKKKNNSALVILLAVGGVLFAVGVVAMLVLVLSSGIDSKHKKRIIAYIEENNSGSSVSVSSWEMIREEDPVAIEVNYKLSGGGQNETCEKVFVLGEKEDEILEIEPDQWKFTLELYQQIKALEAQFGG